MMDRWNHRGRRVLQLVFAAALCAGGGAAVAQSAPTEPTDFRFSGFGTIGLSHVDAPDGWAYKRETTQADNSGRMRADLDTRIGVQLNYAPAPQFELVTQVVATRRNAAAPTSDAIEWAFASWRPDADWTVRGGRVNSDIFLLSDYRNVGFGYPFVRPPVDFYALLPRSLDGVDIAREWKVGGVHWRAKVFGGRAITFADAASRLELQPAYGATVSRDADGLLLRASAVRLRVANEIATVQPLLEALTLISSLPVPDIAAQAADLRDRSGVKDANLTYLSLGTRYESRHWLASAEYVRVSGHPSITYSAGYASVGRRFGALTAFATVSRAQSANPALVTPAWGAALAPVVGPAFAQQAQFVANAATSSLNSVRMAQSTWSLGARYDLDARWALKFQWDQIRVHSNGAGYWGGSKGPDPANASVATVVVDFVF
jgi:hypothetical protein